MASLKVLSRTLSTVPKAKLKPFSEMPGINAALMLPFLVTADFRKGLENTAALWKSYGDIVRISIPLRPPLVLLFDPDICEKVYRAAGAQPARPGFDALR